MWPRRPKRPKVARSEFSAYLRGRVCGLGLGDGEAELYTSDEVPVRLRVAFTIGATSKKRAPVLSESELNRQIIVMLDLAAIVAQVEGDDDPGTGTPLAAPPRGVLGVEETARLHTTRWIGDPLPSSA